MYQAVARKKKAPMTSTKMVIRSEYLKIQLSSKIECQVSINEPIDFVYCRALKSTSTVSKLIVDSLQLTLAGGTIVVVTSSSNDRLVVFHESFTTIIVALAGARTFFRISET